VRPLSPLCELVRCIQAHTVTSLADTRNHSASPAAPAASSSRRRTRSPSGSRSPSPAAGPASDDDDDDAQDEYREDAVKRLPKIGKKKRSQDEVDDDAAAAPCVALSLARSCRQGLARAGPELTRYIHARRRRKKTKAKRKEKAPEPEEDEDAHLDPDARASPFPRVSTSCCHCTTHTDAFNALRAGRRKELMAKITAAAKKPAGTGRTKKRKQQDEEVRSHAPLTLQAPLEGR